MDKDKYISRYNSIVAQFLAPDRLPDKIFIEVAGIFHFLSLKERLGPIDQWKPCWQEIMYRPITKIIQGNSYTLGSQFEYGWQVEEIINALILRVAAGMEENQQEAIDEKISLCQHNFEIIDMLDSILTKQERWVRELDKLQNYESAYVKGYDSGRLKDLQPFKYFGNLCINSLPESIMNGRLIFDYAFGVAARKTEVFCKMVLEQVKAGTFIRNSDSESVLPELPQGRGGSGPGLDEKYDAPVNLSDKDASNNNFTERPTLAALALYRKYHFNDSHRHLYGEPAIAKDFLQEFKHRDIQKYRDYLKEFEKVPERPPKGMGKVTLIRNMEICIKLLKMVQSQSVSLAEKHLEHIIDRN